MILYHLWWGCYTTSCDAVENSELYNHIQSDVDLFLCRHPDAIVMVTEDFNPSSTGFNEKHLKRVSGLTQIISSNKTKFHWCLINIKALDSIQLPPIGSSDHNAILVSKPHLHRSQMPDSSRLWKRDLRNSSLRSFGQWITKFDWVKVNFRL